MPLLEKESLMPDRPNGARRSKVLRNQIDDTQLQGCSLRLGLNDDSAIDVVQTKWWLNGVWMMQLDRFDNGDTICRVGPYEHEKDAWTACVRILKAKGYWD